MLHEAVESIMEQTFRDFELIVVDDGSSDGSSEMLAGYGNRLKIIRTGRHGVSAARNRGAAEAAGRWLAFLDSDDLWLPDKLEQQLNALEEEKTYLFCHTDELWVRRGRRVNPMKKHAKRGGRIFEYCLPMCRISPSSAIIDAGLFKSLGGFDRKYRVCEDYEFWLRLTAAEPVLYIDKPLLVKRGGHSDQLSQSHWGFDRWRVRAIRKVIESGILDSNQRAAAITELISKASVLENGYAKRGKRIQAERYKKLIAWARQNMAEREGQSVNKGERAG